MRQHFMEILTQQLSGPIRAHAIFITKFEFSCNSHVIYLDDLCTTRLMAM